MRTITIDDCGFIRWFCPYCGHCEARIEACSPDWLKRFLDAECLYCPTTEERQVEIQDSLNKKDHYLSQISHILRQLTSGQLLMLFDYLNLDDDAALSYPERIFSAALDAISLRTARSVADYLEDGSFARALYEIIGAFSFDDDWNIVLNEDL